MSSRFAKEPESFAQPAGVTLEEFRRAERLTYLEVANRIGLTTASHARRLALGIMWPSSPETIETIIRFSNGRVTVDAMHRQRLVTWRAKRSNTTTLPPTPAGVSKQPRENCS